MPQGKSDEARLRKNRKRFLLVVAYLVLLLPWVAIGAKRALQESANSPLDWVDDHFTPRRDYDHFCSVFGSADAVILSWRGCTIDEIRIDRLTAALRNAPAFQAEGEPLLHGIISGRDQIRLMTESPISMSTSEAIERLSGSFIGPDARTTCIVIGFTEAGLKQRSRLVPLIRSAVTKHCQVDAQSQHLVGPVMDGYEVDRATRYTLDFLAPLSSALVLVICYLCIGSASGALVVFLLSLFCQGITLALVHFGGGTMTALMAVLGPLVQVLAIAGGIHVVNYYFDSYESTRNHPTALARAFRLAWLPCLLSSATTAIGLGSLGVSGLVAVREFGLYAAVGVVITAGLILTIIPGFCQRFPISPPKRRSSLRADAAWGHLARGLERSAGRISIAAFSLMVVLGIGISRLNASVRIETLFDPQSRLINDYAWLEEHVGAVVPIEIVTTLDPTTITDRAQFDLLERIEHRLREIPQVNSVISSLTFLPSLPSSPDDLRIAQQLAFAETIGERINYVASPSDGRLSWRTTAYVSALGENDYVKIIESINQMFAAEDAAELRVSGLMPLVHEIQQQLLSDLFRSFLTAFGLIAVVMTIVQAGILPGLLSMVPNVFPALTLFGILGWIGRPLDIGTIMTASVAMGIAVDDTLHFLTFYQRELEKGVTRAEAVLASYLHCGRAMIQTTLICGSGLALFILSDFVPTKGFAWMSVLLLSAALVGDLIVLPAMLLSPLGKGTTAAPGTHPPNPLEQLTGKSNNDRVKPRVRSRTSESSLETRS